MDITDLLRIFYFGNFKKVTIRSFRHNEQELVGRIAGI